MTSTLLKKKLEIPYSEPTWHYLPSPYYKATHFRFRDKVRKFVETELMPNVNKWEETTASYPSSLHVKAYKAGIYSPNFPIRYGGTPTIDPATGKSDWDYFHFLVLFDELIRCGSGGLQACLYSIMIGLPPLINASKFNKTSKELCDRIAPSVITGVKQIALAITEPSGGSDVSRIKTTAITDPNDPNYYIVNGEKYFITNGIRAEYFTTAVLTQKIDANRGGHNSISLLLVCII